MRCQSTLAQDEWTLCRDLGVAQTGRDQLQSIYNKLGVNSRVAATRFALEHRLVKQTPKK